MIVESATLKQFTSYIKDSAGGGSAGVVSDLTRVMGNTVICASVGKFSWSDLRWTSSPASKTLLEQFFDAHRLGNFLGAIFDGLLRQLPNLP